MKIHEYQAKAVFRDMGIPVPRGILARTADEAAAAATTLTEQGSTSPVRVVKAQVHAGGRGKAGGVKVVPIAEVRSTADAMLGSLLVTKQTGEAGVSVRQVLIEEGLDIDRELYIAITLDRTTECAVIMASTMGGTEIEEVAEEHPEAILREHVHPTAGLPDHQARRLAIGLGLAKDRKQLSATTALISGLYRVFSELDASMVEVNPLIVTKDGDVVALDGKVDFDDNALYLHPQLVEMRDTAEEDPLEVEASNAGLNYIRLDGNIGCMVNGAGLAMATMDMIKLSGGEPANFLDVGGGASADGVAEALRIIVADENVKAILINIFGGIVRCDLVAEGVIEGAKKVGVTLPVIVRVAGNRAADARKMLAEAPFELLVAEDMKEAAEKAVAAVGAAS